MTVNLEVTEWERVLAILAQAPWGVANPLIMAIGEQLRHQAANTDLAATMAKRPNGSVEDALAK